jgi:divalent metal cation (Fe/Co/Zn/Cd) transporter
MSDQQPAPPPDPRPASIGVSILLFVIGVILLLPGLCALFFMGLGGGGTEPIFVVLWLICFGIAAGGIALIVHAVRRQRRS